MDKNLLLTLNSKKIGLDVKGGELNYISHSHTDHSYALKDTAPIFCSDTTASLLNLEYGNSNQNNSQTTQKPQISKNTSFLSSSKTKKSTPKRISIPKDFQLINAGHILGSTQLITNTQEFGKLLYTGDFKLTDGLTTKGAQIQDCDTLIMECTYGNPQVAFPNPKEVYEQMHKWHKQNKSNIQLWGGYATGKAQELIKFLNKYADQIPIVPPKVAEISQKYTQNGVKLNFISSDTQEAKEIMRDEFTAVFPPHQLTPSFAWQIASAHKKRTKVAIATGWTGLRRSSADISFPLSDHADFSQILKYAKESNAKNVYLAHGKNEHTAKKLIENKINAISIENINNLNFPSQNKTSKSKGFEGKESTQSIL